MSRFALLPPTDPRLRWPCPAVVAFDSRLAERCAALVAAMAQEGGIGLAAPQVGWWARVAVVDRSAGRGPPDPLVLVNPILVAHAGEQQNTEGCLSLPGRAVAVRRPADVALRYQDPQGVEQVHRFRGLAAACALHEMDHLEGRLMDTRTTWGLALPAHQDLSRAAGDRLTFTPIR